jgi:putative methionine-R-sulfoxide reductase with GAF domain
LTAIDFPYPVVPIVRCHHENWDGTGYPSGVKGTDIPIGARILAVVDCFDALTSDRPYRPRLSDDEAFGILFQRRGSMYDPLVVDTFAQVYREIAPQPLPSGNTRRALQEITSSTSKTVSHGLVSRSQENSSSIDQMLALFASAHALTGNASVADTCDVIASRLSQLIPSTLCVFFFYDSGADELVAQFAAGEGSTAIKGMRIELGHRLSGWVAANRRTIVNSDPVLDLGELARCEATSLRSSLSSPLLAKDELVGVLTLYRRESEAFGDDERRALEAVAGPIATSLKRARDLEGATKRRLLMASASRDELAFRGGAR